MESLLKIEDDIRRYFLSKTNDKSLSDDLFQELAYKICKYKGNSDRSKSYYYRMSNSVYIDYIRRMNSYKRILDNYITPSDDIEKISEQLRDKISELPSMYLDIIIYKFYLKMTYSQIQQVTGINMNTLMSRLKVAKQILKKQMNAYAG
jgi:RNA polymerase sigma-70 factor (ECF subfamily)